MDIKPPKYAEKILKFFLPNREKEFLLGDYEYLFKELKTSRGQVYANIWYWIQLFKTIPFYLINRIYWGGVMFLNYLKISLRNIKKQKVNSFINISGLAVGLAAVILLLLYIQYELSYDNYHDNSDRIYRVAFADKESDRTGIHLPSTISPLINSRIPEVENSTRVMQRHERLISYKNKNFIESDFIFADPEIFEIFSFELAKGDKRTALNDPNSIILSEKMAAKYFGSENPIGKTIRFEDKHDFRVTGVMMELPDNSHFKINFLIPFVTVKQIWSWIDLESWRLSMYQTYFKLNKNSDIEKMMQKLTTAITDAAGDKFFEKKTLFYQPLRDIHLYSQAGNELGENADITLIYILASITLMILLIASFNYMNLSTAQSSKRNKEIGIRKVIGANKNQLLKQFIGESFVITAISFAIAFIVVWIILPYFNNFVGRELSINVLDNYEFLLWLGILIGVVSLFAGLLPAFSIAKFNPSSLLGDRNLSYKSSKIRNVLILAQFAISIILLVVTFAIKGQMDYVKNSKVGFEKANIIVVDILDDNVSKNKEIIKSELVKNPNIITAAASAYLPNASEGMTSLEWTGKPDDSDKHFYFNAVDYEFFDVFNIKLADGRPFSREFVSDKEGAIILNETALRTIGWEKGIGNDVSVPTFQGENESLKIIGIAKDFNLLSLHNPIEPFYFKLSTKYSDTYLSMRTTGEDPKNTLDHIQTVIKKYSSSYPVVYSYFEDTCNSYYESETQLGNVITLFTILAIIIACMGLFGLALTDTIQRTKEIGIRKVFGASIIGITAKFIYEFTRYVLIANIIAWPAAYYISNLWLEDFAFRINPQLWMFLLSFGMAFVLSIITVGYHSLKSAMSNPIESLRYE